MAIRQEANVPLIMTIGIISGLLLLVIVFGTEAWFFREERGEIAEKWKKSTNTQLQSLRNEQEANIGRSGPTSMPIDQAMKALVSSGGKTNFQVKPPAK